MFNKKFKKITSVALAALLLVPGLTGCGKKKNVTVADLMSAGDALAKIESMEQKSSVKIEAVNPEYSEGTKKEEENREKKYLDGKASITVDQDTVSNLSKADTKLKFNINLDNKIKESYLKDTPEKQRKEQAETLDKFVEAMNKAELNLKVREGNVLISLKDLKTIATQVATINLSSDEGKGEQEAIKQILAAIPAEGSVSIKGGNVSTLSPAEIFKMYLQDSTPLNGLGEDQEGKNLSPEQIKEISNLYREFVNKSFSTYTFNNMTKSGDTFTYKANADELKAESDKFFAFCKENMETIKANLIEVSEKVEKIETGADVTEERREEIKDTVEDAIERFRENEKVRKANEKLDKANKEDIEVTLNYTPKKDSYTLDLTANTKEDKSSFNVSLNVDTKENKGIKFEDFTGKDIPLEDFIMGLIFGGMGPIDVDMPDNAAETEEAGSKEKKSSKNLENNADEETVGKEESNSN